MKILALEFSSPVRSVAVGVDRQLLGGASEQGSRDTKAFALIDSALREASVWREQIDCIAVGVGPGSYAGIRIAISIAQGWHLARGVKLLGISSADCVAAQLHESGTRGIVNVAVDAQRGELFAARYELESEWRKLSDFALVTKPTEGELVVRPDVDPRFAPDAATLMTLAASREDFVDASQLQPIYLRKAEFVKAPPPRFV